ncbi:DUF3693 domain-containing protein [Pseudoalteromonas ruthenica]|uniref:DUF3693 domain-containing protein n=1 Tax=Pseudoalteromonas ruthenica TaxID=151081 RepID=UPI001248FD09|nr:DUF3693 domain-containing protein [Pseudoalteromonas ruthenica]
MTFSVELIDKYKEHKRYSQDKQVMADLETCHKGHITQIRAGKRHLTAGQCIFLAESIGIDPKEALLNLAAEKAKTGKEKSLWEDALKKISAACILMVGLAVAQLHSPMATPNRRSI